MKDWNYIVIERDGKKYIVDTLEYTCRYIFLHFAWILPVKAYLIGDSYLEVNDRYANLEVGRQNADNYSRWLPLGFIVAVLMRNRYSVTIINSMYAVIVAIMIWLVAIISIHVYCISKRKKTCDIVIDTNNSIYTKLKADRKSITRFVIADIYMLFLFYCSFSLIKYFSIIGLLLAIALCVFCSLTFFTQWYFLD